MCMLRMLRDKDHVNWPGFDKVFFFEVYAREDNVLKFIPNKEHVVLETTAPIPKSTF